MKIIKNKILPVINWKNKYHIFMLFINPNVSIVINITSIYDITILYLIEQQAENPQTNPDSYLLSLLFETRAANLLFGNDLTDIYIKIYGISKSYKESAHNVIRKQVLETRRLVDDLLRSIGGSDKISTVKIKKDGIK